MTTAWCSAGAPEQGMSRRLGYLALLAALLLAGIVNGVCSAAAASQFRVTLMPQGSKTPITGRLIIAVAQKDSPEPRLTIGIYGPAIFGSDVCGVRRGRPCRHRNETDRWC